MAEKDWISRYFAPLAAGQGAAGLRDDVAVLQTRGAMIITTDALVEGVHFLPDDPIETIARKLVRVNVSDVIAKGAQPSEALLTLGWPDGRGEAELAVFAAALGEELAAWGASLIGGDTVRSPSGLFVSLTLTGACVGEAPVRRNGALPGDDLWVTGEIGAGKLGFEAAQGGEKSTMADGYRLPALPNLCIAEIIAAHATASTDISDGLFGDALALAEASQTAVIIELSDVPFCGYPADTDAETGLATWGDDYQTLFTANALNRAEIIRKASENGLKLARIGEVAAGKGLKVTKKSHFVNLPETLGFEHG